MARPRLNQFAEDLGVSRSAAQKLMKKARGRRDGGSEVLEKNMADRMPKPKSKRKAFDEYYEKYGEVHPKDPRTKRSHPMNREGSPLVTETKDIVEAKAGKYMACGGYGKAIQGTKFTGVK